MEAPRLEPLFRAIRQLKAAGVTGVGATAAYHARAVAPLMHRSLPLNMMTDSIEPAGTVLRGGVPSNDVILARLRDAFVDPVEAFPIGGHPPMYPEQGAVRAVRVLFFLTNLFCIVHLVLNEP